MTAHRSKKTQARRRRSAPRFPVWFILAGAAALTVGLVLALIAPGREPDFTPQVSGAPALAVDQEWIDYGDVRLGTTVTTEIRVSNVGSEVLRFQKPPYVEVKEGC